MQAYAPEFCHTCIHSCREISEILGLNGLIIIKLLHACVGHDRKTRRKPRFWAHVCTHMCIYGQDNRSGLREGKSHANKIPVKQRLSAWCSWRDHLRACHGRQQRTVAPIRCAAPSPCRKHPCRSECTWRRTSMHNAQQRGAVRLQGRWSAVIQWPWWSSWKLSAWYFYIG